MVSSSQGQLNGRERHTSKKQAGQENNCAHLPDGWGVLYRVEACRRERQGRVRYHVVENKLSKTRPLQPKNSSTAYPQGSDSTTVQPISNIQEAARKKNRIQEPYGQDRSRSLCIGRPPPLTPADTWQAGQRPSTSTSTSDWDWEGAISCSTGVVPTRSGLMTWLSRALCSAVPVVTLRYVPCLFNQQKIRAIEV